LPICPKLFAQLAEASGNNSITLPYEGWQKSFLQDAKDMRMLEMKGKIDNNRNMDDLLK